MNIKGAVLGREHEGYEQARRDAIWNELKPDRYPELIVRATSQDDVVAAVRIARERGLKVAVRSGGHSWTASGVRDGVLIDLSALREITYDPETEVASAQPGAYGSELSSYLDPLGRFFPTGHCPTVALGGYLLGGGWGWGSRALGPACASVVAVDVVTADGELLHADGDEHSDVLWAARGAGPGFFGVVTRYYLRTHPKLPTVASLYVYPLEVLDELLRWTMDIAPKLSPDIELIVFGTNPRGPDGVPAPGDTALQIVASARAETEGRARDILGILETSPVLDQAIVRETGFPASLDDLHRAVDAVEPAGYRWVADNMWTDAGADQLVPAMQELFRSVPTPISHILWYPWRDQPIDGALSVTGDVYIAAYAGWTDPGADDLIGSWPADQMRRLAPLSKGIMLPDENLVRRNARFLSEDSEDRLERLRAKYDPQGRFHSYLTGA